MPTVSTSDAFTVTNITLTRTLDLDSAALDDFANFIGTVIYDIQERTYLGTNYTLTNGTSDKVFDADSTGLNELFDVLGTAVSHEHKGVFEAGAAYTTTNYTATWTLDCTSTSMDELADVLGTLLSYSRIISPGRLQMGSVRLYQYFVIDIPGETPIKGGSLSKAKSISLSDGEVYQQTFKVAAETAMKIWDKTENEALGAFSFLWLESDLDVLVQFTTDAGTTDAYDVKELKGSGTANEMGPALVLGSDDTQLLDGSIDTFDGTADTIDEIWVYNEDDSDTARVRIVCAT